MDRYTCACAAEFGGENCENKLWPLLVTDITAIDAYVPHLRGWSTGLTTYSLSISLIGDAGNVYSIFGTASHPLVLPESYQEPSPYGVDIGGVNPAVWEAIPNSQGRHFPLPKLSTSQYDSWLSVGLTEGLTGGEISSVGIDFSVWEDAGLQVTDGSVSWSDPAAGPSGTGIVIAQLTVKTGVTFSATFNVRGRTLSGADDWEVLGVVFGGPKLVTDLYGVLYKSVTSLGPPT
jgi:hypothetical protein